MHSAPSYDLAVSVLLTGPRGVGKSTMVKSITNKLGIHLFEVGDELSLKGQADIPLHQVDCFTVLQENSTRTEGSLRGAFSQAANCSPCVLLLRHLEALMHIAQVPDLTQGAMIAIHMLVN